MPVIRLFIRRGWKDLNEQDTWYDRNGRIVFTCSKALPNVGFTRPEWEKIRDMNSGTVPREIDDV
jgi:hypothetical protein